MKCAAPQVAVLFLSIGATAEARTWTNTLGRTFEAEFVRLDGANAIFMMPNGRAFSSPVADLCAADQAVVRGGQPGPSLSPPSANGAAISPAAGNFGRPWPREIRLEGGSNCKVISEDAKTRRYVYESPGYRFTCDARITDDALRNFSVMFETTRKYALGLPLGMSGGREHNGKLDILLFGEMIDYVRAGGPPQSAGCFVQRSGVVMVPMESLGLKRSDSGYSLDVKKKNDVLVHELAHQLTPEIYFGTGSRGWFSEGLAEYMSSTPYGWGYFSPDIYGNSVMSYVTATGLNGSGGRALGKSITAPKLRTLLLMDYRQFSANGNFNYGVSLLVLQYFFHMEGGGKAQRITQFLKGLQQGAQGEDALKPLLGGGTYEKLESDIAAEWAKKGVSIRFGG